MDILEQTLKTSNEEITLKTEDIEDSKALTDSNLTIIDEDGSLSDEQAETLAHAQAILEADDDVHYQWKSDNGVTYRVYQVNPDDEGESVASDFQSNSSHIQPVVLASNLASNHYYVVGNDVLASQSSRSLVPRNNVVIENRSVTTNPTRVRRDDRRRATHNEVERRRRDKINNWILKLSKIIPDCSTMDNNKSVQSKGGILAKACDYIVELRTSNQKLDSVVKENERLASHCEYLRVINEKLKHENSLLRQRSGVVTERRPTQES